MNDVALVGTSPDLTEAVCKLNNVPYFIFQKNSKTSDKPIWLQRLQMRKDLLGCRRGREYRVTDHRL